MTRCQEIGAQVFALERRTSHDRREAKACSVEHHPYVMRPSLAKPAISPTRYGLFSVARASRTLGSSPIPPASRCARIFVRIRGSGISGCAPRCPAPPCHGPGSRRICRFGWPCRSGGQATWTAPWTAALGGGLGDNSRRVGKNLKSAPSRPRPGWSKARCRRWRRPALRQRAGELVERRNQALVTGC